MLSKDGVGLLRVAKVGVGGVHGVVDEHPVDHGDQGDVWHVVVVLFQGVAAWKGTRNDIICRKFFL